MIQRILAGAGFALLLGMSMAYAQTAISTVNHSRKITTGLTYQIIFAADDTRKTIQIENNNTTSTENCFIDDTGLIPAGSTTSTNVTTVDGVTLTAAQASMLLAPSGGSYTRYFPHGPKDPVVGTCTSTGDSIYATNQ